MNNKKTAIFLFVSAVLFTAAAAAAMFVTFFLSPDGEIFSWLSIDGIETWGDRYDLLTLAIIMLVPAAVGTGFSAFYYKKRRYSASSVASLITLAASFLFLLGGLRFF